MKLSALRTLVLALVLAMLPCSVALAEPDANSLLLSSKRIDNYSVIVPQASQWKLMDGASPASPPCASALWTLYNEMDWLEAPYLAPDGRWAAAIVAQHAPMIPLKEWAVANRPKGSSLVVTQDYALCGPEDEKVFDTPVKVVGTRDSKPLPAANKKGQLPAIPGLGDQELGFVSGFLFALKFWEQAPDAQGLQYKAGKYAGTAILALLALIVLFFVVTVLIKKTIKTAFVLTWKIITWPICCLFRKKKED